MTLKFSFYVFHGELVSLYDNRFRIRQYDGWFVMCVLVFGTDRLILPLCQ